MISSTTKPLLTIVLLALVVARSDSLNILAVSTRVTRSKSNEDVRVSPARANSLNRADFFRRIGTVGGGGAIAFLVPSLPPAAVAAGTTKGSENSKLGSGFDDLQKEKERLQKEVSKEKKKAVKNIKREVKTIKKEVKKVEKKATKEVKAIKKEVKKETKQAEKELTKIKKVVTNEAKQLENKISSEKAGLSKKEPSKLGGVGGLDKNVNNSGIDVSKMKVCDGVKVKCLQ